MTLELVLKTSAVLASAFLVTSLLRRAASSTRHLVWNLAIASVLVAPMAMRMAPAILIVPAASSAPAAWQQALPAAVPTAPARSSQFVGAEPIDTVETVRAIGAAGTVLVALWFLACWLASGLTVWRGSRPAPETWINEVRGLAVRVGVSRPIEVRQMTTEGSPHVAGLFRSVIMLPPSASAWTVSARHAALIHELTHIRRRDRLTLALSQAACALYWFNPLVWHAAAALARERERACDDEVLRCGAKPSEYATLLLDVARSTRSWRSAAALSMARRSAIEGRLVAILADAARTPRRSTRWLIGLAVISLTTTILGAQATARRAPAVPPPAPRLVGPERVMAIDDHTPRSAVTTALITALDDTDRHVREQAAMGLAITPGADVIGPLLRALEDADPQVREKAAIGLAFRRDPRIVDPLLTAIEDGDAQVREKAAIALGASGDTRAATALAKAAKDPDAQVREKAVAGLVLLGLRR